VLKQYATSADLRRASGRHTSLERLRAAREIGVNGDEVALVTYKALIESGSGFLIGINMPWDRIGFARTRTLGLTQAF